MPNALKSLIYQTALGGGPLNSIGDGLRRREARSIRRENLAREDAANRSAAEAARQKHLAGIRSQDLGALNNQMRSLVSMRRSMMGPATVDPFGISLDNKPRFSSEDIAKVEAQIQEVRDEINRRIGWQQGGASGGGMMPPGQGQPRFIDRKPQPIPPPGTAAGRVAGEFASEVAKLPPPGPIEKTLPRRDPMEITATPDGVPKVNFSEEEAGSIVGGPGRVLRKPFRADGARFIPRDKVNFSEEEAGSVEKPHIPDHIRAKLPPSLYKLTGSGAPAPIEIEATPEPPRFPNVQKIMQGGSRAPAPPSRFPNVHKMMQGMPDQPAPQEPAQAQTPPQKPFDPSRRLPQDQLNALVSKASAAYGVPVELIHAVLRTESAGDPRATSKVGAQGLMQLMPATAKEMGLTNALDPEQNIMGGTRYIAQLLRQFGGDKEKAIAAYNAGPHNVQKYGGIPPFDETRKYVPKVMGRMGELPVGAMRQFRGSAGGGGFGGAVNMLTSAMGQNAPKAYPSLDKASIRTGQMMSNAAKPGDPLRGVSDFAAKSGVLGPLSALHAGARGLYGYLDGRPDDPINLNERPGSVVEIDPETGKRTTPIYLSKEESARLKSVKPTKPIELDPKTGKPYPIELDPKTGKPKQQQPFAVQHPFAVQRPREADDYEPLTEDELRQMLLELDSR